MADLYKTCNALDRLEISYDDSLESVLYLPDFFVSGTRHQQIVLPEFLEKLFWFYFGEILTSSSPRGEFDFRSS